MLRSKAQKHFPIRLISSKMLLATIVEKVKKKNETFHQQQMLQQLPRQGHLHVRLPRVQTGHLSS